MFISYSREDVAFADEIGAGLQLLGYEVFIDRQMSGGEVWKRTLARQIGEADTVVFLLSPASARSEMCRWEVEEAARHSKRVLPVVVRPLGDAPVPQRLSELHYIYFTEGHSFARSLGELRKALDTNLDWIREHTRYSLLAQRWAEGGRVPERLLAGAADIKAAQAWLASWAPPLPEPTEAQRAFVAVSVAAEAEREIESQQLSSQRTRLGNLNDTAMHVPFLRRFARVLSGSQAVGDSQVVYLLERLLADPNTFRADLPIRVALFSALVATFSRAARDIASPKHRQALLLVALEKFSPFEAAQILDVSEQGLQDLLDEAGKENAGLASKSVLIIEDEPLIALDLENILSRMGLRVLGIAKAHDAAVAAARRQAPDLILSDVQLADGSSGIDAVGEILTQMNVPVIFITSYPERLLTGARPEPAYLVPKPFSEEAVQAVISQALFLTQSAKSAGAGEPRRSGLLGRWFGSSR